MAHNKETGFRKRAQHFETFRALRDMYQEPVEEGHPPTTPAVYKSQFDHQKRPFLPDINQLHRQSSFEMSVQKLSQIVKNQEEREKLGKLAAKTTLPSDWKPNKKGDAWRRKKRRIILKFRSLGLFHLSALLANMPSIDKMPDKVLTHIFSYLPHKEILRCAFVCKKWKRMCQDPVLWQVLSFRPNYDGLQVTNFDFLLQLIGTRFVQMRWLELSTDLITPVVLSELANKCPKLQYMTLDFSTAMQLHDFTDLQTFPSRLRSMTLCLSENIFLEGFLRKIYTFIASVEILHVVGTYEKIEDEEEEVYETVNIHKLKQYMPNLRIVNLWGVAFVTDEHVDSLSSNCARLECLCINYCQKVTGSCLKVVLQRCRQLRTLLLAHTSLENKHVQNCDWEKCTIQELDITATELNSETLAFVLCRLPHLRWLNAGFLEHFTDEVLQAWIESGSMKSLQYLDIDTCDTVSESAMAEMVARYGQQLFTLNLGGHHRCLENFWMGNFSNLSNIRTMVMGIAEDCCPKVQAKIHIDSFIDCVAQNCPQLRRMEIRWDDETLRFSDKSSKFIDVLRMRCQKLHSIVLSDGRYYELVRANCERADRMSVVRTTEMCHTSNYENLRYYHELLFN